LNQVFFDTTKQKVMHQFLFKNDKNYQFFIADKKRLVQSMPNATLTSNYDEHFCKHINFWVKHTPF